MTPRPPQDPGPSASPDLTTTHATDFDRATHVAANGDGRFAAALDPQWNGPFDTPNGGVIAAILLRAAQAELARPDLPPRILNVQYLRRANPESAHLHVQILRVGRRNATVQASLHQREELAVTALITFSAPRPHTLTVAEPAPGAPPPDQVAELDPDDLDGAPPALRRLRLRPCFGAPILGGSADAVTGGWFSLRDDDEDRAYDAARLVALCDLWWPAVFGAARQLVAVPTLDLTVHLRATTSVRGPILGRFHTALIAEGHLDEIGQLWSATGQLLAESRQLALLTEPHRR